MKCKCGSTKIWISTYKDMQGCDDCGVITGTEKPVSNRYLMLGEVRAIDARRYFSIIADIKNLWRNGSKREIMAIDWMAKEIYCKFIVMEKKATVSSQGISNHKEESK